MTGAWREQRERIPRREIAGELKVAPRQVAATAALLAEGATVPFIARYRKEATGSLDEVAIAADPRPAGATGRPRRPARGHPPVARGAGPPHRRAVGRRGRRRDDDGARGRLRAVSPEAPHPRHHRARSRPRAARRSDRREPGDRQTPSTRRRRSSSAERNVPDAEAALAGARDILAERFSDDAAARASLRQLYWAQGAVRSVARARQGRRGRQVQGLLRLDRADLEHPESPPAGDSPRRGRGDPARAHRPARGCRAADTRAPVRDSAGHARRRAGPPGRPRQLRAPARARPSRARSAPSRRRRPTPRRSACSPTTCASCCWRRRSASGACWPSTRDSAPAARWRASTRRDGSCTTT